MKNIQEYNSGEKQNLNSFNNTEQNSNFHIDINTNKANCIHHQETEEIKNIILKNNVIKIQRVYRNYKSRKNSNKKIKILILMIVYLHHLIIQKIILKMITQKNY